MPAFDRSRACLALAAAAWPGLALAAEAPQLVMLAPPAAASAASAPERPRVSTQVIEDKNVRIEETRIRGQLQRITVQSKIPGVRGYEIVVDPTGKDPSHDRGAAGQSAWHLLDF